jgi:thioredoxin-like negative regulator of GroEL
MMTAIAERIDRRLSQLPPSRAAQLEHLLVGLLDFAEAEDALSAEPSDDEQRRARGLAALNRIAARGGIAGISDPMAWQREQRADRSLPGREP